jgi:FkbM family methyltransferase
MTAAETFSGKYHALRTLLTMIAWFKNWSELWQCHRSSVHLPPLRFRRGFTLHHRSKDQVLLQFYEVFRDRGYRRYITEPRRGTVIDIGANIGVVTLDWATRLPDLRVHAYEPHPASFAMLCENVQVNHLTPRIATYREAVGGRAGVVALRASELSMEATAYGIGATPRALEEFNVAVISLDTVIQRCNGDGAIALAKIDAEGAEADILEGADAETLREIRQFVIEYHDYLCPGALERCERVLVDAGFCCVTRPATPNQGLLYAWRDRGRERGWSASAQA